MTAGCVCVVSIAIDAMAAMVASAASAHATRALCARRGVDAATGAADAPPTVPVPPAIHRSSRARSPALCQRSSGSLARQLVTTRSRRGGESLRDRRGSSRESTRSRWLATPSNARLPVSISSGPGRRTQKIGAVIDGLPPSCSGAMYCTVPSIAPCDVSGVVRVTLSTSRSSRSFATPKSSTLAPDLVNATLPGLRSR